MLQHRKSYFPLLVLVFVSLMAFYLFNKGNSSGNGKELSLTDPAGITSILLRQGKSELLLEKNEHTWLMDNNIPADVKKIEHLLDIFSRIMVQHPVLKEKEKELWTNHAHDYLQVAFNNEWKNIYLIFEQGLVYASRQEKGRLVNVKVPGIDSLESYFDISPAYWRTQGLIRLSFRETTRVKLYKTNIFQFEIIRDSSGIFFLHDSTEKALDNINVYACNLYWRKIAALSYENLITNSKDSAESRISKENLLFSLLITNAQDQKASYAFYTLTDTTFENRLNPFRLYALENDSLLFQVTYLQADPLLKEVKRFLKF